MTENFDIKDDIFERSIPFSVLTDDSLESFRDTLGLSMSCEEIRFCRDYYTNLANVCQGLFSEISL